MISPGRQRAGLSIATSTTLALLAVIQSRFLGPENRGLIVLIQSISATSAIIGSLGYGIARSGVKFERLTIKELKKHVLISISISLVALFVFSLSQEDLISPISITYLTVTTLSLSSTFLLLDLTFVSKHSLHIRILILLLTLTEIIVVAFLGVKDEITLANVMLISSLFSTLNLVGLIVLLKEKIDYKSKEKRRVFSDWPYLVYFLAAYQFVNFYRLPSSVYLNTSEIANLSVAFSIAFIGMPFIYHVAQHLKAQTMSNGKIQEREIRVIAQAIFLISLSSLILAVYSNALISLTVGREFSDASPQLRVISGAVPPFTLFLFYLSIKQGLSGKPQLALSAIYLGTCSVVGLTAGFYGGPLAICFSILIIHVFLGVVSILRMFSLAKN